MNRPLQRAIFIALSFAVLLSFLPANLSAAPRIYVSVAPPAPPTAVVVRPARPSARHVWVDGYHRWDGRAYVWVPGEWREPPHGHTHWVAGHWSHHGTHGWYWTEGHWRK